VDRISKQSFWNRSTCEFFVSLDHKHKERLDRTQIKDYNRAFSLTSRKQQRSLIQEDLSNKASP